jgi:hypothetical protein
MQTNIFNNTLATDAKTAQKAIRFIVDPLTCVHIASCRAGVIAIEHYPRIIVYFWQPTCLRVVVLGPCLSLVTTNIMNGDNASYF